MKLGTVCGVVTSGAGRCCTEHARQSDRGQRRDRTEKGPGSDSNVRTALIDRFGGKDAAIGRKANPGPLCGIAMDLWSALAIAVTYPVQSPI